MANLYESFRPVFERAGDKAALRTPDGRETTYAALEREVVDAQGWLHDVGVRRNDRVVAWIEKSAAGVVLHLAALRAGAVWVPLNTAYTEAEVGPYLADTSPTLFVCDSARLDGARAAAGEAGVPKVRALDRGDGPPWQDGGRKIELPVAKRDGEDVAAILYTSGTTGMPKGAMLTHAGLEANVRALCERWRWRDDDVLLHVLPIFHVHGLYVALHCALRGGSTILFEPSFDARRVVELLSEATVVMGVPTHYGRLADEPGLDRSAAERVRLFLSGSAPLPDRVRRKFEGRSGGRIVERYGLTEALILTSGFPGADGGTGDVGTALPGVELRVVDDRGEAIGAGETGVLEARGPGLFRGYWQRPEATRQAFREDGYFVTGDLATIDEAGRVRIVGREKDLVISGGLNVAPLEVERALEQEAEIRESAVIGVPHPDFGEAVVAVVVPDPGAEIDEAALRKRLRGRLAAFKVPKRIVVAADLPRNAMGKIQKAPLRERHRDLFENLRRD